MTFDEKMKKANALGAQMPNRLLQTLCRVELQPARMTDAGFEPEVFVAYAGAGTGHGRSAEEAVDALLDDLRGKVVTYLDDLEKQAGKTIDEIRAAKALLAADPS